VSEKRVLRRIFGPKRDGVAGDWRKVYEEDLYNLYSSQNIIRRMRWVGGKDEKCVQNFGQKFCSEQTTWKT
jgi:hypothetical protein